MYYAEEHGKVSNCVKKILKLTNAATKAPQECLTSHRLPRELYNIELYEYLPSAIVRLEGRARCRGTALNFEFYSSKAILLKKSFKVT